MNTLTDYIYVGLLTVALFSYILVWGIVSSQSADTKIRIYEAVSEIWKYHGGWKTIGVISLMHIVFLAIIKYFEPHLYDITLFAIIAYWTVSAWMYTTMRMDYKKYKVRDDG